jgi:hypothetical protein
MTEHISHEQLDKTILAEQDALFDWTLKHNVSPFTLISVGGLLLGLHIAEHGDAAVNLEAAHNILAQYAHDYVQED